jgi:Xaa-Pro aminopeptidase
VPPKEHARRLARAAEAAGQAGLDAVLVAPSADLVYLTAYDPPPLERLTCLVLRPGRDPVMVVPRLERPLAEGGGVGTLAELRGWGETEDPYAAVAALVGEAERVGCSDQMWSAHLLSLQRATVDVRFESASPVIGALRAVKDGRELDLLKRAARYADEALARLIQQGLETRTERDVAGLLADLLLETGNDEVAFTIVGAGPNGASPHHEPTGREIHRGDPVVMDFGARTGGYCSDITRTVAVGEPPPDFRHVFDIVREAQEEAFRAVAPGVPAQEVDRTARRIIEREGYGELFVHRTGHGIGLEEHEPPYIVEGNDAPLRPGMCFSIEPGIYVPGEFGVRIEDIVTVTETGAQRLNHASRDLEVVR